MKMKKITAVLLSAVMAFSAFGCGKDKNESKKVDADKLETIGEALVTFDSYRKGNFSLSCSLDVVKNGKEESLFVSGGGDRVGDDYRTGALIQVNQNGQNMKLNLMNSVVITDGKAYLNFDRLFEALANVNGTTMGSYAMALPESDKSKKEAFMSKLNATLEELINAVLADAKVEGEKGSFTAIIDNAQSYKKFELALYDYLDKNWDTCVDLYKEVNNLYEAKAYVNKLFDGMEKDLIDAANVLGFNMTEGDYKNFKNEVLEKADTVEEPDYEALREDFDCKKKSYEELSDEDWEEIFEIYKDNPPKLTVKANEESYDMQLVLGFSLDGDSVKMDFSYSFKNDKETKIEKPSNVKSLKEMAEYLNENSDFVRKLIYGMTSVA